MKHNRAHLVQLRVVEAPLIDAQARRSMLVERMAKDLVTYEAAQNKRDAVRCLFGRGDYHSVDIAHLVDEARQVAFQEIVAREMAKP